MLAILFPHLFEEVEYLIPKEELSGDIEMADATAAQSPTAPRHNARALTNAVAGPSRRTR